MASSSNVPAHWTSTFVPARFPFRTNLLVSTLSGSGARVPSRVNMGGSAPSGYVDFKFISLPLAIVSIDCTIVRVIEPQRLLVVLHNRIFKERI
jgi:hypothetical protein